MVAHKKNNQAKYVPYFITTLLTLIAYFFFYSSDILTFLSFIVLVPIFLYFKYDSRIPIGFAILMLLLAGIVLSITQNLNFANLFAIYAYWLLVVGIVCLTINYVRERKRK